MFGLCEENFLNQNFLWTFCKQKQKAKLDFFFCAASPEVYMFAKDTTVETNVMLTCLATGFYPKDITLQIKKKGRVVTIEDGLVSSGVRPNGDDTFQRRDSVEISRNKLSDYTCEVIHMGTLIQVDRNWGK